MGDNEAEIGTAETTQRVTRAHNIAQVQLLGKPAENVKEHQRKSRHKATVAASRRRAQKPTCAQAS
jgi:hypothetical protein